MSDNNERRLESEQAAETPAEKRKRAKPRPISEKKLKRELQELARLVGPALCASDFLRDFLLTAGGIYCVVYPSLRELQALAQKKRGFRKEVDGLIERKWADPTFRQSVRTLLESCQRMEQCFHEPEPPESSGVFVGHLPKSKDQRRQMHKIVRSVKSSLLPAPHMPSGKTLKQGLEAMLALAGGGRGGKPTSKSERVIALWKSGKMRSQKTIGKKVWPRIDPEDARRRVVQIIRRYRESSK